MKRFIRILLIGALLGILAYTFLREPPCPPARQIHAQWENIIDDYHASKITFNPAESDTPC